MKTLILAGLILCSLPLYAQPWASTVQVPPSEQINSFYQTNQPPLTAQHLVKLPVGAVKPYGWLKKNLELERDGLAGHLDKISAWLTKKNNAWLSQDGKGDWGWEELPYWLKGYANIGYVINDKKMIDEAMVWINGTLNSQRPDGDFGPFVIRNTTGKRDLWAQMLMLFVLQSYYEYSHDTRVINHLTRYFQWQLSIPENDFLTDYWENSRGGDNLYSVYWLYNITQEKWLLTLAEKIHRNTANWKLKNWLPNWHNVNIAQCFREPAVFYQQSHDITDLQASYNNHLYIREQYGQVPGGMWGGDENSRKGYTDPRQAIETCGMVEQMTSDEIMMRITGDTFWAENCEDVAFNTFPAAFMPDYKSLRYLTAPNMVISDSKNHHPGIDNAGPHLNMNPFSSRCCQHNHTGGWIYYTENLWMATSDNGLAAVLYADSEVKAKVAGGDIVSIREQTHYPFEETITLKLTLSRDIRFPLYLRLPSWCDNAQIKVNQEVVTQPGMAGQYVRLIRNWKHNDLISIEFPMKIKINVWTKNKNSVSINRGPLTYSLKIQENYTPIDSKQTAQYDSKWQENSDPTQWPSYEIHPASIWNYGLSGNLNELEKTFEVVKKPWPQDDFPFTLSSVPLAIKTKGKKIPSWGIDQYGLCGELPLSPIHSNELEEEIILVPMGAARLRISAFPVTK